MALSLTRSRVRILSCLEKTTTPVHHLCLQLCCRRCCRRCENWGFPASLTFPRARARARERGRETEKQRLCERERERERERDTDIHRRTYLYFLLTSIHSLVVLVCWKRESLLLVVLLVSWVCAAWVFCPSSAGWLSPPSSFSLLGRSKCACPVSRSTAESIFFFLFSRLFPWNVCFHWIRRFWPPVDCILCLFFVCLHAEMVLLLERLFAYVVFHVSCCVLWLCLSWRFSSVASPCEEVQKFCLFFKSDRLHISIASLFISVVLVLRLFRKQRNVAPVEQHLHLLHSFLFGGNCWRMLSFCFLCWKALLVRPVFLHDPVLVSQNPGFRPKWRCSFASTGPEVWVVQKERQWDLQYELLIASRCWGVCHNHIIQTAFHPLNGWEAPCKRNIFNNMLDSGYRKSGYHCFS